MQCIVVRNQQTLTDDAVSILNIAVHCCEHFALGGAIIRRLLERTATERWVAPLTAQELRGLSAALAADSGHVRSSIKGGVGDVLYIMWPSRTLLCAGW